MANRFNWYLDQLVTEGHMDTAFQNLEQADRLLMKDQAYAGVVSGYSVTQHAPTPDLTVDIAGPGIAYDQEGRRVYMGTTQTLNLAVDSNAASTAVATPGNEKWVSVFVQFDLVLSNQVVDGNSQTVYFNENEGYSFVVVQGSEAAIGAATRPALLPDALLIADVRLENGDTQIVTSRIESADTASKPNSRFQYIFNLTASLPATVRKGPLPAAMQAVLTELNNHIASLSNPHPATAIAFTPVTVPAAWTDVAAATEVNEAINAIVDDLGQTDGGTLIGFSPTGNLAATNIGDAIIELDNEKGGLSLANIWTNQQGFQNTCVFSTGDAEAMFEGNSTVLGATTRKLVYQGQGPTGIKIRLYQSDDGLEITRNAVFADPNWTRDDNAADSAIIRLYGSIPEMEHRDAGDADSWTDANWSTATGGKRFRVRLDDSQYTRLEFSGAGITHIGATIPPHQHALYPASMVKAWGQCDTIGLSDVNIQDGFNVSPSSGLDTANNEIDIVFARPMSNINYSVCVTMQTVERQTVVVSSQSTTGFSLRVFDNMDTLVDVDARSVDFNFIVLGRDE